jgi:hypothetical protein
MFLKNVQYGGQLLDNCRRNSSCTAASSAFPNCVEVLHKVLVYSFDGKLDTATRRSSSFDQSSSEPGYYYVAFALDIAYDRSASGYYGADARNNTERWIGRSGMALMPTIDSKTSARSSIISIIIITIVSLSQTLYACNKYAIHFRRLNADIYTVVI